MGMSTAESSRITSNTASAGSSIVIRVNTMDSGTKARKKARACLSIPTKTSTLDFGSMAKSTVRGPMSSMPQAWNTSEVGSRTGLSVGSGPTPTDHTLRANFTTTNPEEREGGSWPTVTLLRETTGRWLFRSKETSWKLNFCGLSADHITIIILS